MRLVGNVIIGIIVVILLVVIGMKAMPWISEQFGAQDNDNEISSNVHGNSIEQNALILQKDTNKQAMQQLEESIETLRIDITQATELIQNEYNKLLNELAQLDAIEVKLQNLQLLEETKAYVASLAISDITTSNSVYKKEIRKLLKQADEENRYLSDRDSTVTYPEEKAHDLSIANSYRQRYFQDTKNATPTN